MKVLLVQPQLYNSKPIAVNNQQRPITPNQFTNVAKSKQNSQSVSFGSFWGIKTIPANTTIDGQNYSSHKFKILKIGDNVTIAGKPLNTYLSIIMAGDNLRCDAGVKAMDLTAGDNCSIKNVSAPDGTVTVGDNFKTNCLSAENLHAGKNFQINENESYGTVIDGNAKIGDNSRITGSLKVKDSLVVGKNVNIQRVRSATSYSDEILVYRRFIAGDGLVSDSVAIGADASLGSAKINTLNLCPDELEPIPTIRFRSPDITSQIKGEKTKLIVPEGSLGFRFKLPKGIRLEEMLDKFDCYTEHRLLNSLETKLKPIEPKKLAARYARGIFLKVFTQILRIG